MKVLHVVTSTGGGAGAAAVRQHKALLNEGIESHILALNNKKEIENIHLYRPGRSLKGVLKKIANKLRIHGSYGYFERVKRKHRPECEVFSNPRTLFELKLENFFSNFDVINLHWVNGLVDYLEFFDKVKDSKIFWTLHDLNPFSGFFHYKNDLVRNPSLKKLDDCLKKKKIEILKKVDPHYIVLNDWMKEELLENKVTTENKISKVYNSVNVDIFKYRDKLECRDRLSLSKDKVIVTFICDYLHNYRKGMDILFGVLEELKDMNIEVIAIGNDQGPQYSNITYIGRVESEEKLAYYYAASDFFVLPSREDNLPNVMVEALCVGCPVLSFNIGGMREIIDSSNGYKSDPSKENSFLQGFKKMLNDFSSFNREEISKNAQEKFNPKLQVEKLRNTYGEC